MTAVTWVLREVAAERLVVPSHVVAGLEVALDSVLAAYAAANPDEAEDRAR